MPATTGLANYGPGSLATAGSYARLRHPQYVGFALVMSPILLVMYWRLALREEREAEAAFGNAYRHYATHVSRLLPVLRRKSSDSGLEKAGELDCYGVFFH